MEKTIENPRNPWKTLRNMHFPLRKLALPPSSASRPRPNRATPPSGYGPPSPLAARSGRRSPESAGGRPKAAPAPAFSGRGPHEAPREGPFQKEGLGKSRPSRSRDAALAEFERSRSRPGRIKLLLESKDAEGRTFPEPKDLIRTRS